MKNATDRKFNLVENYYITVTNYSKAHPANTVRLYDSAGKCLWLYEMPTARNARAYLIKWRGKHWARVLELSEPYGLDGADILTLLKHKNR